MPHNEALISLLKLIRLRHQFISIFTRYEISQEARNSFALNLTPSNIPQTVNNFVFRWTHKKITRNRHQIYGVHNTNLALSTAHYDLYNRGDIVSHVIMLNGLAVIQLHGSCMKIHSRFFSQTVSHVASENHPLLPYLWKPVWKFPVIYTKYTQMQAQIWNNFITIS